MADIVIEIAMVLSLIVQLGLLAHCFRFKQELPVMYSSIKTNGNEMKDIANDAYLVLLDMIEMLDDAKVGGTVSTNQNQTPTESIMNTITHQLISNLIPTPNLDGVLDATKEIYTENEDTQTEN